MIGSGQKFAALWGWFAAVLVAACAVSALAQQDTNQPGNRILEFPNLGPIPGGMEPSLGPGPGALEADNLSAPGGGVIGGRRRSGRVPRSGQGSRPGLRSAATSSRGMRIPETLPAPNPGRQLAISTTVFDRTLADDAGPANGLSLDAAIEQMIEANLDVQALRQELTQADADILTAGLRTNPLIYMDSQFIPYGAFNDATPGGPTQYDLNITYPLDVSQKRQARTVVARLARTALEAQFQDVVRRQIDNVYRAFVSLQSARIDLRAAQAAVRREETMIDDLRRATGAPGKDAEAREKDRETLEHLSYALDRLRGVAAEAQEAYEDAQESLALLLNISPEETAALEPQGALRNSSPAPPELEELVRIAQNCRPDIRAARLGVSRATAEVGLQRANRFDDVYIFYDPITVQDNRPIQRPDSRSWAVGVTFALPIYNRNQGNIARAQSNVQQTRGELSSLERRAVSEVRLAEREFQYSKRALERIETLILPQADTALKRASAEFATGDIDPDAYQDRLEEAAAVAQNHREAVVRHRRSMLDLNTAVGLRLLP